MGGGTKSHWQSNYGLMKRCLQDKVGEVLRLSILENDCFICTLLNLTQRSKNFS